jgi:hypothetical protein
MVEAFTQRTPIVNLDRYLSTMTGAPIRRSNGVLLYRGRSIADERLPDLNAKWL